MRLIVASDQFPLWRPSLLLLFSAAVVTGTAAAQRAHSSSTRQQSPTREEATAVPIPSLSTEDAPLVLRGVTVIDVQGGRRLPAQTVVIVGTRVRVMGSAATVRVPSGARVVDARGKYVIPGLWDMHVHVESNADLFYPLFIAYGVTGVRDAGSHEPLATLTQWKQEISAGTRVGPRLYVAGPQVWDCSVRDGFGRDQDGIAHTMCFATPSEARLVVDFLKLAGADFIKPYYLSRESHLAVLAEARRIGIPVGGHYWSMSGLEASDSGARFLDHITWFNPNVCGESSDQAPVFNREQCATAAERLRRNNTWLVDTPGGFGGLLFPEFYYAQLRRFLPDTFTKDFGVVAKHFAGTRDSLAPGLPRRAESFADWRKVVQSPSSPWYRASGTDPWVRDTSGRPPQLHNYAETPNMPIVAGTDAAVMYRSIAGYGLHEVLVSFVLGGMTPLQALQTATLNPATALQATDSLGSVAAGKVADLVLLDADPLQDIWNTTKIRAVVANGRYYNRAALDGLMAQTERTAHPQIR